MSCCYPKGSKPKTIGAGPQAKSETTGHPYRYNAMVGRGEAEAFRNLRNDYGKDPQPTDLNMKGVYTGIMRTIRIVG